jgi:hypothetical protein
MKTPRCAHLHETARSRQRGHLAPRHPGRVADQILLPPTWAANGPSGDAQGTGRRATGLRTTGGLAVTAVAEMRRPRRLIIRTPATQSVPNPSLPYRDGVGTKHHDHGASVVHGWYVALAVRWMRRVRGTPTRLSTSATGAGASQRGSNRSELRAQRDRIMKIVFESSTATVAHLDNGHLLHTDRTSGQLYRSRGTWENFESAQRAYQFLPGSAWEPVRRPD